MTAPRETAREESEVRSLQLPSPLRKRKGNSQYGLQLLQGFHPSKYPTTQLRGVIGVSEVESEARVEEEEGAGAATEAIEPRGLRDKTTATISISRPST